MRRPHPARQHRPRHHRRPAQLLEPVEGDTPGARGRLPHDVGIELHPRRRPAQIASRRQERAGPAAEIDEHPRGPSAQARENLLARLRVLDLKGLGSREVSRHRRNGSYSTAVIRELARERGIRIAVVYTSRLLPEEWTLVGTWTISNNIVCGGTTVSFLAAESSEIHNLLEHLRSFSSELPRGVVWKESIAGEVIERTHALDEERRSDRTVPRE